MKKHCKKFLLAFLVGVCVSCLAVGLSACNPDNNNEKSSLNAPEISLFNDIISWDAVDNADGYEVFEGEQSVSVQTELSFKIPERAAGNYIFAVKATSSSEDYSDSALSESITFTVVQLAAPQITSIKDGLIEWSEVENAGSYDIYENGNNISAVETEFFRIRQDYPDTYSYYIVAHGVNNSFAPSEPSNTEKYQVPLTATLELSVPEDFTGSEIKVEFSTGSADPLEQTSTGVEGYFPQVSFTYLSETNEYGTYIIKATGLPEGYVSTWARITRDNRNAEIDIIKADDMQKLNIGNNTIELSGSGEREERLFIATNAGKYSVKATYGDQLIIYAGETMIVDAKNGLEVGVFEAGENEPVLLAFNSDNSDPSEFSFELIDGEIPQFLRIGSYTVNETTGDVSWQNSNTIVGSCTRYITIEKDITYDVLFFTATTGSAEITFKINGKETTFTSGYSKLSLSAADLAEVDNNGEPVSAIKIEIEVKGTTGATGFITFCIFEDKDNILDK